MGRRVHEEDSGTVRIANPRTFFHFLNIIIRVELLEQKAAEEPAIVVVFETISSVFIME